MTSYDTKINKPDNKRTNDILFIKKVFKKISGTKRIIINS